MSLCFCGEPAVKKKAKKAVLKSGAKSLIDSAKKVLSAVTLSPEMTGAMAQETVELFVTSSPANVEASVETDSAATSQQTAPIGDYAHDIPE